MLRTLTAPLFIYTSTVNDAFLLSSTRKQEQQIKQSGSFFLIGSYNSIAFNEPDENDQGLFHKACKHTQTKLHYIYIVVTGAPIKFCLANKFVKQFSIKIDTHDVDVYSTVTPSSTRFN